MQSTLPDRHSRLFPLPEIYPNKMENEEDHHKIDLFSKRTGERSRDEGGKVVAPGLHIIYCSSTVDNCVDNNGRMPSMHSRSRVPYTVPLSVDIANMIGGIFPILPPPGSRQYLKLALLSVYPLNILLYYTYLILDVFIDKRPCAL